LWEGLPDPIIAAGSRSHSCAAKFLKEPLMTEKHNWDRCWEESPTAEFDFLTRLIFKEMEDSVSFRGRSVLELGCGTGRLSFLAMQSGASEVTLVDSSHKAIGIAQQLFHGIENVEILEGDFRSLQLDRSYDIVFSSGVVEHFSTGEIEEVVKLHQRYSRETVLTIVPAAPHYNNLRMKKPEAIRLYGWQKPLTGSRMATLFSGAGIDMMINRKFYPLYAVPRLNRIQFLDRMLRPLEGLIGGLLITAGRVRGDSGK
jgi:cyclopropane fatty-acyl-phospholipid synthase-like methyltransferase